MAVVPQCGRTAEAGHFGVPNGKHSPVIYRRTVTLLRSGCRWRS